MQLFANAFYWLRRLADPPLFVVTFSDCGVRCARGMLAPGWLEDCRDIAEQFGITSGHVDGRLRLRRLHLHFSPAIPAASHQRFRNALGVRHHAGR